MQKLIGDSSVSFRTRETIFKRLREPALLTLVAFTGALQIQPARASIGEGVEAKLSGSTPTRKAELGRSVAIEGEWILAGSPEHDEGMDGIDVGKVDVFRRSPQDGWQEHSFLPVPDTLEERSGSRFGASVSMDGNFAIVGAPDTEVDVVRDAGAVHIYERIGGTSWHWVDKIRQPSPMFRAHFGHSVAIDGERAVVASSSTEEHPGEPAIFIFERQELGNWEPVETIDISDIWGAPGPSSILSVDLDGDTIVVGDENGRRDLSSTPSGVVYVLERQPDGEWTDVPVAPDPLSEDFGASVAIDGGTIIVGSAGTPFGISDRPGSAFIYEREGGGWMEKQEVYRSIEFGDGDAFGHSVAIDEGLVTVGDWGTGAAYVYGRSNGGRWNELAAVRGGGATAGQLGWAVAIGGETVVAGDPGDDEMGSDAGSVSVLELPVAIETKLLSETYGLAGTSVSLSGDTLIVGAPNVPAGGVGLGGTAFFSVRGDDGVWSPLHMGLGSGGVTFAQHGVSVATDGTHAIIGSYVGFSIYKKEEENNSLGFRWAETNLVDYQDPEGSDIGYRVSVRGNVAVAASPFKRRAVVFIYSPHRNEWRRQHQILFSFSPDEYDGFGESVSVSEDAIFIGAPGDDERNLNAGAVYTVPVKRNILGGYYVPAGEMVKIPGTSRGARFGASVSTDGNYAVVGAPNHEKSFDDATMGRVSFFERVSPGGGWVPKNSVRAPDTGGDTEYFGFGASVSVDGETAIVGERLGDGAETRSGTAYVFTRGDDGDWNIQCRLGATDGDTNDSFGGSVSTSGGKVVVGASGAVPDGGGPRGAAYIYEGENEE